MAKNTQGCIVHTKSQKFFGGLAFVMLFICGVMVGAGVNDGKRPENMSVIQMTESQCDRIADLMTNTSFDAAKLAELNKIYSENCAGRLQPKRAQPKPTKVEPQQPCETIEEVLSENLLPAGSFDYDNPEHNLEIYRKLASYGCPENQEKYYNAISAEQQIIRALNQQQKTTCEQIEDSLMPRLPYGGAEADTNQRIERAKIYAVLAERGCPENSGRYADLAKQELEIARALQDDEFSEGDTIEIVETYKRLNMQAAAEEIFETAKKLTNPAIDFILEVEKIINEK